MRKLFYGLIVVATILSGCGDGVSFKSLSNPEPEIGAGERPVPPNDTVLEGETRAIVIFNADSSESEEIAHYYAKKRNIPLALLSGVHVPDSLFGDPDGLLSVRSQVLTNTLCPLFAQKAKCDAENFQALLEVPNLPTHLVFVKGIPTQLRDTGWVDSTNTIPVYQTWDNRIQPTSFDFYLAYLLLSEKATCLDSSCFQGANSNGLGIFNGPADYSYYFRGSNWFNPGGYLTAGLPMGSGKIPFLDPAVHRTFAYGRLDGITKKNVLDTIDRTLVAEMNGLDGNFFGSRNSIPQLSGVEYDLAEFTGSLDSECLPTWTTSEPGTSYPVINHPSCRVQFSQFNIPAFAGGNVHAVNKVAGFFGQDGMTYYGNAISQYGFAGDFDKVLSWRHSSAICSPLCSDITNLADRLECENTTLDPYKTINTACVGVEPGFIGTQYRSFPVQYMGSYAKGWNSVSMGPSTASPMELSWEGGVQTSRFSDSRFIYFGDPNYRQTMNCYDRKGASKDCDPKVEIYATRTFNINPISLDNIPRDVVFSFYWKGYSARAGRVNLLVQYLNPQNQSVFQETFDISVLGAQDSWRLVQSGAAISSATLTSVNRVRLLLFSPTSDGSDPDFNTGYKRIPIYGYFALDGIRARMGDGANLIDLISSDAGSFNEPYTHNLTSGSWAGDIARMGGGAFFGSLSHFLTGGGAWADRSTVLRSFFSGNTLGQSLLYVGTGISGIFYGDPLYSIGGAALYLDPDLFMVGAPLFGKSIHLSRSDLGNRSPNVPSFDTISVTPSSSQAVKEAPLFFDASFAKVEKTEYRIEFCGPTLSLDKCEWEQLSTGQGPVKNQIVPGTEQGLYGLARGNGYHFLRIKIYPLYQEERAIYRYARFYFLLDQGELPYAIALSSARFVGSTWDETLREDLSVGSLVGSVPLRYGNVNNFVIRCQRNAILGFDCKSQHWELDMTSVVGNLIPSYTRTEQNIPIGFNTIRETTFTFSSNLGECDLYNMVLRSGGYSISFLNVLNLPADANGDRMVSQADFNVFRNGFNLVVDPNGYGDFNGDLYSSQTDFVKFRNAFNCSVP